MSFKTLIAGLFVSMMLTACGPSAPEVTSTKFDGTYVGTIKPTPLAGGNCLQQSSPRMVGLNGKLDFSYAGGIATYHTGIHEDGSFSDWALNGFNGETLVFKGKIMQDSIEATTENRYCKNELNLKRVSSQ